MRSSGLSSRLWLGKALGVFLIAVVIESCQDDAATAPQARSRLLGEGPAASATTPVTGDGPRMTAASSRGPSSERYSFLSSGGPAAVRSPSYIAFADPAPSATNYLVWQNRTTGDRGFWSMSNTSYLNDWIPLGTVSTLWNIAATADFTGDLKPDILWQNISTGEIGFWPLNGTTWTGEWLPLTTVEAHWRIAGAADMTGDGKADIVWQNVETGERGLWPMNGTARNGQYIPLYSQNIAPEWDIASAKDMTGDGKADLVWQNTQTGERGFWTMNNTVFTGWTPTETVATSWDIAAAAEMTGDGKSDLIWTNSETGDRGLWVFNRTMWTRQWIPFQPGIVAAQWEIAGVMPVIPAPALPPHPLAGTWIPSPALALHCSIFTFPLIALHTRLDSPGELLIDADIQTPISTATVPIGGVSFTQPLIMPLPFSGAGTTTLSGVSGTITWTIAGQINSTTNLTATINLTGAFTVAGSHVVCTPLVAVVFTGTRATE